jgi:hypothetical protein
MQYGLDKERLNIERQNAQLNKQQFVENKRVNMLNWFNSVLGNQTELRNNLINIWGGARRLGA